MTPPSLPKSFLQWLRPQLPRMLQTLGSFVRSESPSTEKSPADACAQLIAAAWRKRNVSVELFPQKHFGAHIRITLEPTASKSRGQLLVLGHYDTVYASGTLASTPFRVIGGRAFGPGIFDMKAGIVQALFALDALQHF